MIALHPMSPLRRNPVSRSVRWKPGNDRSEGEAHHGGSTQGNRTETTVTRADDPRLLEYKSGDQHMRWELEAVGDGTRLLWHNIDRHFIAMGAAGWHICFDVLEHLLGRVVGPDAIKFGRWQQLYAEYAKQFGIPMSNWRKSHR
jgi:hypothetical protein